MQNDFEEDDQKILEEGECGGDFQEKVKQALYENNELNL